MKALKKLVSCFVVAAVITTSLYSPKAKAVTDPYAALASATVAAYAIIAIGGTMAIAGIVWTIKKVASRDVAIQEAKDDALVFLANDGQEPSMLLQTIFEKTKEQLAVDMSEEELAEYTDVRLAEMLLEQN